ncbi:MAG: hypothetical protein GX667_09310 [Xanthomonadaceae bacterium]|nr:hypothetical protein [Xanthomonadaceae bacterium]
MNITSVKFHDQTIQVLQHEDKPYIAMRSLCENIGLDWEGQRQRINRNKVLKATACMIKAVAEDGKSREIFAIPLGYLNGWLAGIDINRVKPEIRETLYLYQLECYDVLYNHFLPEVAAVYPNTIDIEQQHEIKSLVNEVSRKSGIHYQGIYTRLYEKFKIPRYQELSLRDYPEAIEFLNSLVIPSGNDVKKRKEQAFVVGVIRAGIEKRDEASGAYDLLVDQLMDAVGNVRKEMDKVYEIGRKIRYVNQSCGIVHDAMAEPYARLNFDKSVYEEGQEVAKKLAKPLNLEGWS